MKVLVTGGAGFIGSLTVICEMKLLIEAFRVSLALSVHVSALQLFLCSLKLTLTDAAKIFLVLY